MDVNQNATAEHLLLRRVEMQLEDSGIRGIDRAILEETLRSVLDDPDLIPEEEVALVPSGALSPGRLHSIDRFLAMRVERAVQAALQAGAHRAGLRMAPVAPRVVVHRTRQPSEDEIELENRSAMDLDIPAPLPTVGEQRLHELSLEGRGVLVLADGPVVDGYLDRHGDFRIGDQPLGLHVPVGDADTLITLGDSTPSAVHVLEFGAGFLQLEAVLANAIHSRMDTTAPPGESAPPEMSFHQLIPILRRDPEIEAASPAPAPAPTMGPADPSDPLLGMVFDEKYMIVRRIGKGGFGVVYEARDVRLDHRVAIKVLHTEATRSAEELDAFKNEARRATRLSHPNIVDWKTFEQSWDGVWYFVMELLEGEELDAVMKREGVMSAERTGRILLQVLDALRTAHNVGEGQSVLHLDLKPKNVFLLAARPGESEERVKVIDFGIGQFIGPEAASGRAPGVEDAAGRVADADDAWDPLDPSETEQTLFSVHTLEETHDADERFSTGSSERVQRSTACTPEYAAPEQCAHLLPELQPLPLDGRADIYAVGVVGFQMLTGQMPHDKPKRRKDLLHLKQTIPPHKIASRGVRVPRKLAQFLDRCLARDREERFRDSTEAYEALRAIVHPPLRKSALVAAGILVIGAVASAWIVGRSLSRQGLDLYTRIDDVEESLAGSRLHLGPARDHALLRVSGLDSSAADLEVRIVDSRDGKSNEIPGFHAEPQSDGQVLVSADRIPTRIQQPAYLEVKTAGGEPTWSVPFDLVWLGEAAWEIESVSVENLGERALDPAGALLEIRVRGAADDFSSVRVEHGGRTLAAQRDEAVSRGSAGLYRMELGALDLEDGNVELRALATDKAGRTLERSIATYVATGPLTLSSAALDATAIGGRYSISPRGDPNLSVIASRKADFTWTVKDENGGTLMKGTVRGIDAGKFPLTGLTRLREGRSFSGSIDVVADESAYVLHAAQGERGVAAQRLDFLYAVSAPDYTVRLTTPDGGLGKALDASRPVFVSSHDLVVRFGRENSLPLMAQVVCAPAAPAEPPGQIVTLEPQILVDRERITADFPLKIADDGEYALTVRVWRYDTPDQDTNREPDSVFNARVVIDSIPAGLSIEGISGGIVLRSKSEPLPQLEIQVQDEPKTASLTRTPVDLHWDLVLAQRPEKPLASGILGTSIPGGAPATMEIPAPWSVGSKQPITCDGTYRILFQGVDAAGNTIVPAAFTFEAAVDGPELELSRPAPRIHWPRGESGGFDIQVVARDPNGVADVRGILRRAGADDIPFQLHSTGDSRRVDVSVWNGTVSFDESWSNTAVEVHLAAEDGFGTSAQRAESRELGDVDRLFPLRIAVDFDGVPVEALRLVEGNNLSSYTFGGRIDAEEERVHSAAGLPPYNSLSTSRSWRVVYEPHEIPSFYLDEHEVSVEQYLAFVRGEGGYVSNSNWPAGAASSLARRESLEQMLSALQGDLPVVDVTWEEATAYANWVGKRLPSLVEWEYAVRGGALYRPFASAGHDPKAPTSGEVNFDFEGEGNGGPWPCSQGGDMTPDTGIHDLCGNVSEWTATPASFLEGALTPIDLGAHVLENRARFLDARSFRPTARIERFWIAGGSFLSARSDFSVVDRRGRAWHGRAVGFRCAADAGSVTAVTASAARGRPRFQGIFE